MKILTKYILIYFLLYSCSSFSQKKYIKKINESLEIDDFNRSFQLINDLNYDSKSQIIRGYYKSKIFEKNNFTLYNLDSSYFHISECQNLLSVSSIDEINRFCKNFEICLKDFDSIKRSISWKRLNEIKKLNDILITKKFMEFYISREDVTKEALKYLEDLEFNKACKSDNLLEFSEYLNKYPQSKNYLVVKSKIEELKFKSVIKSGNVDSLNVFLIEFPKSIFNDKINIEIQKLKAQNVLESNSIKECENYITNYPKSVYIPQIKIYQENLEFERLKNINDVLTLDSFLTKFPRSINYNYVFYKIDSILSIEENYLKYDFNFLSKLLIKHPKLKSNSFVSNYFENLFVDYIAKTNDLIELKKLKNQFYYLKNIEYLISKIEQITDLKLSEEFEKIDLSLIPGYEYGSLNLIINSISFLDSLLIQKLNNRKHKWKYENEFYHTPDFKSLPNDWYYMDDVLFKTYAGNVKAISIESSNSRTEIPSEYARKYVFSDSIVISPNGFFINLFSNTYYSVLSNEINWPLKAFNDMNFALMETYYGRDNEISNDSLEFRIIEISDITSNFFNKYNLKNYNERNVPDHLNHAMANFECIKGGNKIEVFNNKKNRIEAILDKNILMMDAQKIQLDRTGQLLIVESFNHLNDYDRGNKYSEKEYEIIIFNISDFRQLITIPGKLEDISNQNELILNLESQCRHDPNDYTGRNKINELAFTKLDLNELIENKSKFNAKKITKSFNLNEFTTNDDFINKLNDYNVFYDATNNFTSDFVSNNNYTIIKRTNFEKIISEYKNYFDRFHELYRQNIKQLNRVNCEIELQYNFYNLQQKTCGLTLSAFRENCNPLTIFLSPLNDIESTTFYNGFGEKLLLTHTEKRSNQRVVNGLFLEDRTDYFEAGIRPEYIENNHDSIRLEINIKFDSIIDIYSPARYKGDYEHIINNCLFAIQNSNEKINTLFFPKINNNYGILTSPPTFDASGDNSQKEYDRYVELKRINPYDSKLIPPGCTKIPDIHWVIPTGLYTDITTFYNSINFKFFDPIEEYSKNIYKNHTINPPNASAPSLKTISNIHYLFYVGKDQFIGTFE